MVTKIGSPSKKLKTPIHLLETAKFAIAWDIHMEPAFAWWVENILKTQKHIIDKVKSQYWKVTMKFGIEIPKNINKAFALDDRNNNDYWQVAINKEIKMADIAYKPCVHPSDIQVNPKTVYRDVKKHLVDYQEITYYLVFDIKLDINFTHKARFVADGSKTKAPKSLAFSSIVSQYSVSIAFLAASLNNLDLSACDISGAYLNAPCSKKVWFEAGPECGRNAGKVMVVTCALYGLKSSTKAWWILFAIFLEEIGFKPCVADPDMYMKAECIKDSYKY